MGADPAVEASVDRRTRTGALAAALVPPFAWLVAFAVAYVVQDFTCSWAATGGGAQPGAGLRALVLAVHGVALLAIVVAGVVGWRLVRAMREDRPAGPWWFLAWTAVPLALVFAFATALVAWPAMVLRACQ